MGKSAEKKSKPPIHEERWFESAVLLGCMGLVWLLWQGLDTASPIAQLRALPAESLRILDVARQLAQGQYLLIFSEADLPPLYPALLAGLARLGETDLEGHPGLMNLLGLAKALNFYAYLVGILLINALVRNRVARPVSFLLTALVSISPVLMGASFLVTPTVLYLVCSLGALALADRVLEAGGDDSGKAKALWCLLALALGGALLSLPIGYTLLLAFLLAGTRKLGLRKVLPSVGIVLLLAGPFTLRDAYYDYEPGIRAQGWQSVLPAMQAQTHAPRLQTIARDSSHSLLGELRWGEARLPLESVVWLRWSVLGLIALGMAYGLWQRSGISSLYVLCYSAHLCFLEPAITPHSFAPLLPLLLMYLYLGLMRVGEWMGNVHVPLSRFSVPALSGLLALSAITTYVAATDFLELNEAPHAFLAQLAPSASSPAASSATSVSPASSPAQPESAQARAQRWLALNAPSTALVGHADETLIPRPRSAAEANGSGLLESLLRLDYIVEEPAAPEAQATFNRLLQQARSHFQLVYHDPQSNTRIWQVMRR